MTARNGGRLAAKRGGDGVRGGETQHTAGTNEHTTNARAKESILTYHTVMLSPMDVAKDVLREVFGFNDFRTGQAEAIEVAMRGDDAAVLLPTGAGKSLCFQVPGIARARLGHGPTLVVSPLIALMADQVDALRGRGVRAAALNSHQSAADARAMIADYESGEIEFLYVSPERAAQDRFRQTLERRRPGFVAIDEAHCVSQWGHDFRPEYMQLAELRAYCDGPMMAVTATATPRVLKELMRRLGLESPHVVRGDFRRPNLSFSVELIAKHDQRTARLVELLDCAGLRGRGARGKAIIYCSTRKHTEKVAADLTSAGFAARHYHAGRTKIQRERAQNAFAAGRVRVLVATSAFGMGIDFPDVRLVAHFQSPGSLEAYYQEAGRAGRDHEPARCVLFFSSADMATQRLIGSGPGLGEALQAIESYALTEGCRERNICEHFGMTGSAACGRCDVCTQSVVVTPELEARHEAIEALSASERALVIAAVGELSKPAGKTGIARALRGSRAKSLNKCGLLKLPQHGALRGVDERAIVRCIEECLDNGELIRKGNKYPTIWIPGKTVRASTPASAPKPKPAAAKRATKGGLGKSATRAHYTPLQGALERFRQQKARELKWKPYMVFQKKTIVAIDDRRPSSLKELQTIPGLGNIKIDRFGKELLRLVEENP